MPRFYRELMGNNRWKSFRAEYRETDLWIAVSAGRYSSSVEDYSMSRILHYREILEDHIIECPGFRDSLVPLMNRPELPPLVHDMYVASGAAGTGPMSAVAGTIAEYVCNDLITRFGLPEAVVENGGDIFMKLSQPATIAVYAGESPLSDTIGLIIKPQETPLAVCCSSGTFGHSLSLGRADACVIACRSGALADALATATCNRVMSKADVAEITELTLQNRDVISVVIIKDDKVGIGGKLKVTILSSRNHHE